jgi:mannose-1-phosphate guanylyltransferase
VVVQPQNKGSASSLLFALTYLRRRHADALVAVFPANGEFRDDGLLMTRADAALRYVERHPEVMVILGVEPARVECGFGYVVPDGSVAGADPPILGVSRFIEQPSRRAAEDLIQQGALWNTSILVFRLGMLLDFVWRTAPLLPFAFTEIAEAIGSPEEYAVIEAVYDRLPPVDFARGVLELVADGWPSNLAVLRVDATP